MQNISKYSSWLLYALMIITVICFGMFYLGGVEDPNAEYAAPVYTNTILNLGYIVLVVGAVLTIAFALFQFALLLKDHPKQAVMSIVWIAAFAILLIIGWAMGDGTPLNLPSYDGSDNTYFWLKLTDMWLFAGEFLLGASILLIIGFSLLKVIRK
ncbi:MAG: hypothetical protein Q4F97_10175 [Bacteroidales bacterium]|nr:hypothetical protein [Bacteroidales bacterium]